MSFYQKLFMLLLLNDRREKIYKPVVTADTVGPYHAITKLVGRPGTDSYPVPSSDASTNRNEINHILNY